MWYFFQPSDQKSILEFFSPSQSSSKRSLDSGSQISTVESATPGIRIESQNSPSPKQASKRQKLDVDNDYKQHSKDLQGVHIGNQTGEAGIVTPLKRGNERKKENVRSAGKTVVVIDSESDGEAFDTQHRKKKSTSKKKNSKQSKTGKRKLENDKNKSRCDIMSLLSQKSKSQSSVEPMVVSDSESNLAISDTVIKPVSNDRNVGSISVEIVDFHEAVSAKYTKEKADSANSDCDLKPVVPDGTSSVKINNESAKSICDNIQEKKGTSLEIKIPRDVSCDQWSCSMCTFLNHKDLVFCEMCETPKKKIKTNVVIKQHSDTEKAGEKLQAKAYQKHAVTNKTFAKDKRNVTVVKRKPEITEEFSINGLKQNIDYDTHFGNGNSINSTSDFKKVKRYSNHLHDLSSSDEEPLENQIENYDSDLEDNANDKSALPDMKSADFIQNQNHGPQSPESVLDMPKSKTRSYSVRNNIPDGKNESSSSICETNCDVKGFKTHTEVKTDKLSDSDCSSPKPGSSSEVHTPKQYKFKPFNTPKQYRFKSVNRSLQNSPLTPPPVLNGCYSKEINGSMLKETNYRQSPQSPDGIGRSALVSKTDTKDLDNNKLVLDGFNAKTGGKPKVSAGIRKDDKADNATEEATDSAEFSSPEMEELYAGVDVERMEQIDGAGKTNVRRQLDRGEN